MGPSIKYVTLFLANTDSLSPCHTLSHIPGPPQKYVTHLGPPRFLEGLVQKTRTKGLLYKFSQLFAEVFVLGVLSEDLLTGRFYPGWFLSVSVLSEYIRKLNITLNFMFRMYDNFFYKCDVTCSFPLPLSQTVTPSRTPSPSSVTYFMDGP